MMTSLSELNWHMAASFIQKSATRCLGKKNQTRRYLGDVEVEAEALALPLHLPHTQLAGELAGAQAEPLQGEGAVQVPLGAVPDVVERDFLQGGGDKTKRTAAQSDGADRTRPLPPQRHHQSSE